MNIFIYSMWGEKNSIKYFIFENVNIIEYLSEILLLMESNLEATFKFRSTLGILKITIFKYGFFQEKLLYYKFKIKKVFFKIL